jgi:hypothetical protein
MIAQWCQVVWLIATGVAAGSYVLVAFALAPTIQRVSAATAWAFHRIFDPQVDRYMPPTVALGVISGIAVLITRSEASAAERVLIVLAILGMAAAAITSLTFNMRINRQLGAWTEAQAIAQEGDFRALRARWNSGNLIRTFGALLAFLIAVVLSTFQIG